MRAEVLEEKEKCETVDRIWVLWRCAHEAWEEVRYEEGATKQYASVESMKEKRRGEWENRPFTHTSLHPP